MESQDASFISFTQSKTKEGVFSVTVKFVANQIGKLVQIRDDAV